MNHHHDRLLACSRKSIRWFWWSTTGQSNRQSTVSHYWSRKVQFQLKTFCTNFIKYMFCTRHYSKLRQRLIVSFLVLGLSHLNFRTCCGQAFQWYRYLQHTLKNCKSWMGLKIMVGGGDHHGSYKFIPFIISVFGTTPQWGTMGFWSSVKPRRASWNYSYFRIIIHAYEPSGNQSMLHAA